MDDLAKKKGTDVDRLMEDLKSMYNGYQFTNKDSKVYCPWSVMYALESGDLRNYWYKSGTPRFLKKYFNFFSQSSTLFDDAKQLTALFQEQEVKEIPMLQSYEGSLTSLLYSAGYLSIKHYDDSQDIYTLGFPNNEIKVSFANELLEDLTKSNKEVLGTILNLINRI